jgi:hypothetical protein
MFCLTWSFPILCGDQKSVLCDNLSIQFCPGSYTCGNLSIKLCQGSYTCGNLSFQFRLVLIPWQFFWLLRLCQVLTPMALTRYLRLWQSIFRALSGSYTYDNLSGSYTCENSSGSYACGILSFVWPPSLRHSILVLAPEPAAISQSHYKQRRPSLLLSPSKQSTPESAHFSYPSKRRPSLLIISFSATTPESAYLFHLSNDA